MSGLPMDVKEVRLHHAPLMGENTVWELTVTKRWSFTDEIYAYDVVSAKQVFPAYSDDNKMKPTGWYLWPRKLGAI